MEIYTSVQIYMFMLLTCTMYTLMQTISVSPFSVSIHVAVEFPSTDTLVAAEVAGDVLGSVLG